MTTAGSSASADAPCVWFSMLKACAHIPPHGPSARERRAVTAYDACERALALRHRLHADCVDVICGTND